MSKSIDPLRTTAPELPSKGMIIIVGDSWACGEWSSSGNIAHRGLEQYLVDDGYDVINYGQGGSSNSNSYLRLLEALVQNRISKDTTKVFFFWTDWHRDLYRPFDIIRGIVDPNEGSVWRLKNYEEQTCHRLFYRIIDKLQKIDLPIGIIGGCSDTIPLGDAHLRVYTACQSFVNLCLHDIDTLDDAVYTVFTDTEFGKDQFRFRSSRVFLDDIDKANARQLQWKNNPQWFWPDGMHPNRHAYRKLYDFLKMKNCI